MLSYELFALYSLAVSYSSTAAMKILSIALILLLVVWAEVSSSSAADQTLRVAATASLKPTPSDSSIRRFVYPHDDLKDDSSFQEFRHKLKEVAARRDADALYKAVSPDFFLIPRSEQGKKRKDDRRGLERFKSA